MYRVSIRLGLAMLGLVLTAACSSGPTPPVRPDVIALPAGFQPEGISAGRGSSFFVGSIPTGAVFRGDARTGRGAMIVDGRPGRSAIGLEEAGGRLYVAGGATGQAFVYDAATGDDLRTVSLTTTRPSFINDVVVTSTTAFFTDSLNPVIYRVDLATMAVTDVHLGGDIAYRDGFNANGIEATADGATLVVAQTNTGLLFGVDARTGTTRRIALTGESSLPGADGLLLDGQTLYVVQNLPNQIAVVRLGAGLTAAAVAGPIVDPRFDAPTTVASIDGRLHVVNARIDVGDPAVADYQVIVVDRPGGGS